MKDEVHGRFYSGHSLISGVALWRLYRRKCMMCSAGRPGGLSDKVSKVTFGEDVRKGAYLLIGREDIFRLYSVSTRHETK
jgi:hypothetical protein